MYRTNKFLEPFGNITAYDEVDTNRGWVTIDVLEIVLNIFVTIEKDKIFGKISSYLNNKYYTSIDIIDEYTFLVALGGYLEFIE